MDSGGPQRGALNAWIASITNHDELHTLPSLVLGSARWKRRPQDPALPG